MEGLLKGLDSGGMYVCPKEGVNVGSGEIVERRDVSDVTVESFKVVH